MSNGAWSGSSARQTIERRSVVGSTNTVSALKESTVGCSGPFGFTPKSTPTARAEGSCAATLGRSVKTPLTKI
ncbi:MAG: hypothetical protein U0414_21315 [Polyangiaceae bacterium]